MKTRLMTNEGEANPALAPVVEKKLTVGEKEKLVQPLDIQALMPKKDGSFSLKWIAHYSTL